MSEKDPEIEEFRAKLETLRCAEAPNQVALELLKSADQINELVVVVRDHEGKLHATWTDQDMASVTEAAAYLQAVLLHEIFLEHEGAPEDEGDLCDDD